RAAGRILVLDLEFVAVDACLVDLVERELDTLLVLHPEIRARTGHREQASDLDDLVLRLGDSAGSQQDCECRTERGGMLHGVLSLKRMPEATRVSSRRVFSPLSPWSSEA